MKFFRITKVCFVFDAFVFVFEVLFGFEKVFVDVFAVVEGGVEGVGGGWG